MTVNIPPITDDEELNQFLYELAQEYNQSFASNITVDNQGRVEVNGSALGYPEQYLTTFYAAAFEPGGALVFSTATLHELDSRFVEVYQLVRNQSDQVVTTELALFTPRQINLNVPAPTGVRTVVFNASELPTNPAFGDRIQVRMAFSEPTTFFDDFTQLFQAGGDPVLLADYSDATGGTTTGGGAVFADIGSAIDNIQLNTGSDRENNSVAYSQLVTDNRHLAVRDGANGEWQVWGQTLDSSPNGNQLRVRSEANATLQIDANPGWQVGFATQVMETIDYTPGWYFWNGQRWETRHGWYRLTGGRQIDWMFVEDQPTNYALDTEDLIIDLDDVISTVTGVPGVPGANGNTTGLKPIFRRSETPLTAADTPTGGTFNPDTGDYAMIPMGWSEEIPMGTASIWASFADIFGNQVINLVWSTPALYGEAGEDGPPGDTPGTAYLLRQALTEPTGPSITEGFDVVTGRGRDTADGRWTVIPPSVDAGNALWLATLQTVQPMSTGDYEVADGATWIVSQASGYDGPRGDQGPQGSDAPRFAERTLYTNPAINPMTSTVQNIAPAATITWSTGELSNITTGWMETPPTQIPSSDLVVFSSTLVFVDPLPPFSTTDATGSTPEQGINFSGLVTFTTSPTSGSFAVDGGTITNINGGDIFTGTITADQLVQGSASTVSLGSTTATQTGTSGNISLNVDLSSFVSNLNNDYIVFVRASFGLTGITSSTRSTIGGSDNATVSVSYNNDTLASTVLPIGNAGVRDGFIMDGINVSTTLIVDPAVSEEIVVNGSTFSSEFSGQGTLSLDYEVGVIIR